MIEKRFRTGFTDMTTYVLDIPIDKWNKLDVERRVPHTIVKIRHGGMVSPELAASWAKDIVEILNRSDASILTISKIT